jgi:hypothetical protein
MLPLAAVGLAASAGSTIFQGFKGLQQTREAKEMQKNLGPRVNYQIPEEAKRALALYQNMAVSQTMPGQQLMQNMIDMQQAKALGGATRAATSSQDLLGVMSNLGEQGMMQQQELGLAAAQNYTQRQQDYAGALGTMAGYQEKVTADRQQNWYERAAAAKEMRQAGLENTMGAVQGLGQMGLMAAMGGFGGEPEPRTPVDIEPMNTKYSDPQELSGLFQKEILEKSRANRGIVLPKPKSSTNNSFLGTSQQLGQEAYGADWQSFVNGLNFQKKPQ